MLNEKNFQEIGIIIFNQFFSVLLSDTHTSKYFTSKAILDDLGEKQIKVIYTLFELLNKSEEKKAFDILYGVAKKHFNLGIGKVALFKNIDLYASLLKEYRKELEISEIMIKKLKELLEEATAKLYIETYLQNARNFLNDTDYEISNLLVEKIDSVLLSIESYYENKKLGICLESHTTCEVAKNLNSLGFYIMCYGNEDKKLEIQLTHKLIHDNINEILSSLELKNFLEAISNTQELVTNINKLVYDYEKIYDEWSNNKYKIISKILVDKHERDKYGVILLQRLKESKYTKKVIIEIENLLSKFLSHNIFYEWLNEERELILFMDKKDPCFAKLLDLILKNLEKLAQKISDTYLSAEGPIFAVIKMDSQFFNDYTHEELIEAIEVTKEELLKETKDDLRLIIVKDLYEDFYEDFGELIKTVRDNLRIKKCVIEKVLNKDVDIFVQWIYDLNLNKKYLEVLGRVKDQNNKYIPVYNFLKILEKEKLMNKLDEVMYVKLAENIDKIKKLTNKISVNIYPDSLNSNSVIYALKILADECNKNNIELDIEITEYSVVMNKDIFDYIKGSKVYLAIDDFGAGYTNFELIGSLKERNLVKTLKIDGSIVRKLPESEVYKNIAITMSEFARVFELDLVYEYVDSEEIINKLKEVSENTGISFDKVYLQGFYLHRPSLLDEEVNALK